MNDKMNLRLTVNGYRAINDATIDIGDITVLSGVNACGKSSLAHLFHTFVNASASFDIMAQDCAFQQADKFLTALSNLVRRIRMSAQRNRFLSNRTLSNRTSEDARQLPYDFWHFVHDPSGGPMQKRMTHIKRAVNILINYIGENYDRPDVVRYVDGFCNDMGIDRFQTVDDLKTTVDAELSRIEQLYEKVVASRSGKVLNYAPELFSKWLKSKGSIELKEGDSSVIKWDVSSADRSPVGEVLSLDKAVYIESPWRSIPIRQKDGVLTVQDGLTMSPPRNSPAPDKSLFSVLQGSVAETDSDVDSELQLESDGWDYNRKDGEKFDLSECATGIKSFSILNILYERGFLDRRTLLIVDEPEAHLHPQWIFEYAKILVRLNKQLGVRLLITTHSPDMLNAIKHVSDVEDVEGLNFYLASPSHGGSPYTYSYEPLGRDVEKIFAVFNYAMDMTDLYGRNLT